MPQARVLAVPPASSARPPALAAPGSREDLRARETSGLHGQLEGLLAGLRLDIAWLDRCLAEQASTAGNDDAARTLRLEMRIRCDGMGDQLDQVTAHLDRIVGQLRQ